MSDKSISIYSWLVRGGIDVPVQSEVESSDGYVEEEVGDMVNKRYIRFYKVTFVGQKKLGSLHLSEMTCI